MSRIRRQDIMSPVGLLLLLVVCYVLVADSFTVPLPLQRQSPSIKAFSNQSPVCLWSSSTNQETISGEAESIFQKNCDQDGLMTKASLEQLAFIKELMDDGDLMKDELEELWSSAPKFPGSSDERIDVDSFVQIYRDIDDLFEDDDDEDEAASLDAEAAVLAEIEAANTISEEDQDDNTAPAQDEELATIFKSIANDSGLLTREALSEWEEVQSLMDEGLFDEEEFNGIWDKMPKTDGQMDLVGFLKFNSALDELFDFEDLDEEEEDEEEADASDEQAKGMVDDANLSPAALYEALADADGLVGMEELKRWGELQEMIEEGDLMPLELENFFDAIAKSEQQPNKLNREGFLALYDKIDSLFEDDDDDEEEEADESQSPKRSATKEQLLSTISSLNQDEERLPCGLEGTESEQKYVQELVSKLEAEPTNEVRAKQGAIEMTDLAGEWELLYTSSSAMAYNKGLSGLGGSFPNGSFGGLKMKLVASKYMTDVEYTERIKVVPDTASFDVTVNGSWELRSSVSIFTGQPSIVLTVVPDRVTYGPTSTRADHWKSLGPTNMLDVSYLDEDLRVMRGNTSTDSILIFKRTK